MRLLKSYIFLISVLVLRGAAASAQDAAADTVAQADIETTVSENDSSFRFDSVDLTMVPELEDRVIPDSTLQRLRTDEAFWYANAEFKKKIAGNGASYPSPLQRLFSQAWFHNLLWIIIIVSFVSVLLLFLWKSDIRLFRKSPTIISTPKEETFSENIFSINYAAELTKAIQDRDFRLAIRLQYLQTLVLLSEKNIIQYKEDFTNSDYIFQVYPTAFYAAFKKLTRHFEYAWYGKLGVTPEAYRNIETDFSTFKNSMGI